MRGAGRTYLQGGRDADTENSRADTGVVGTGGVADIYTPPCVEQTGSGSPLCSRKLSPALCDDPVPWGGGGGRRDV